MTAKADTNPLREALRNELGVSSPLDHRSWASIDGALTRIAALASEPVAGTVRPQPVAWVIPGDDNARENGSIDAMAWEDGEFSKPLYAAPPAPAGREEIARILNDHFWTGEPGQHDAIKAATEALLSLSPQGRGGAT